MAKVAPLVAIVGETASGKSDLAIKLAEKHNGEIICADSRTIYKGMDVGTAKPSKEDQKRVPHQMIDLINPDQAFSVADFKKETNVLISDIWWHGKVPIMVGGSGLYVDSVIFDYQFDAKESLRDPKNPRHLLKQANRDDTKTNLQQLRPNTLVIGLKVEKEVLEQRIKARVEQMVENGLVKEAKVLGDKYGWDCESIKGSGYQYFGQYQQGTCTLQEAKDYLVRDHLRLAKKQRTWFKRNKYIHWIENTNHAEPLVQTFLTAFE